MNDWMHMGGVGLAAALALGACGGRDVTNVGVINTAGAGGERSSGGSGAPLGVKGLVCDRCEVIADTPDIRAVRATADRVYWIEYGSFDELGNYLDDGRLMSVATSGGEPTEVTAGLQGPTDLALSDDYAYVVVTHSTGTKGRNVLLQFALADGSKREFAVGTPVSLYRSTFVSHGGSVFWANNYAPPYPIYQLEEASAAEPDVLLEAQQEWVELLAAEGGLYLHSKQGIEVVPPGGSEPAPRWNVQADIRVIAVVDGYIYAEEAGADDVNYVTRMPTQGGAFKRIAQVPPMLADFGSDWAFDGERFAFSTAIGTFDESLCVLMDGKLATLPDRNIVASIPCGYRYFNEPWAANASYFYFAFDDKLYRAPRSE